MDIPNSREYVFYAVWEPQTYLLKFSANVHTSFEQDKDGVWKVTKNSPKETYGKKAHDDIRTAMPVGVDSWEFTIPDEVPTKDSSNTTHEFYGWNNNEYDAYHRKVKYLPGSKITVVRPQSGSASEHIYAVWADSEDKVTYESPAKEEKEAAATTDPAPAE